MRPGAHVLPTVSWTGYEHQIAFLNPDGEVVVVMHNPSPEAEDIEFVVHDDVVCLTSPPSSFATVTIGPEQRAEATV